MSTPNLTNYIADLTNGCAYLDSQVSANSTDKDKLQMTVDGLKTYLTYTEVSSSSENLASFNTSITNAENYIATL